MEITGPDWANSFKKGVIKQIYFVTETKSSMLSKELREIEKTNIKCAKKFFDKFNRKINTDNVKYDVVSSYSKLMEIANVRGVR